MSESTLQGKVIMMTGAGGGLGRAMALALAREGAKLSLIDMDGEELQAVAGRVQKIGGAETVIPLGANVCDPESSATAVHYTVKNFGRLDVVFYNAALGPQAIAANPYKNPPKFWKLDPFTFIQMVNVNTAGPQLMAAAAIPHIIQNSWGRAINITTALDAMCVPGMGAYGPSKGALEAQTAIMARGLDGTGVTANVLIQGGPVNTRMIPDATGIPRDALIQLEEMHAPAVWLASKASDSYSGKRCIAGYWHQGKKKASAPCPWPQLGKQAILPETIQR